MLICCIANQFSGEQSSHDLFQFREKDLYLYYKSITKILSMATLSTKSGKTIFNSEENYGNVYHAISVAEVRKLDLYEIDLSGYDLEGIEIKSMTLTDGDLSNMNLQNAKFTDCILVRVDFDDTDLSGAIFTGCTMIGSTITNCDVTNTIFNKCDLSHVDFNNTNFEEATIIIK